MEHRDIAAIAAAAEALHASIQIDKTAQASLRRQVKRKSKALEELQAAARRHGVNLEITQTPRRSQ